MAVEVMISRKVQQGRQAREMVPLILQLRALATVQPGYISGKTLVEADNTGELLVISTWESIETWKQWSISAERAAIEMKIEAISGQKAEYKIYEPIVFQKHGD
ncbi:MAG: antibiotic biosynthesis monooxygenase [Desulfobacterales bacterium]|jgi:antibiotic biosynthesis monooxygenase (ABM) superfamily enzyme